MWRRLPGNARRGGRILVATDDLAEVVGQGSITFAPQVKGLEIPGYEPRALQTMALGFAVGSRGADHNRSGAYEVDFSNKVDRRHATLAAVHHAIDTEDRKAGRKIACPLLALWGTRDATARPRASLVEIWKEWADDVSGTEIAFVSDRNKSKEIFVMNADGSDQTRLTNHAALDALPAWSQDGKTIVFVSDRIGKGQRRLYVMEANGNHVKKLTRGAYDMSPDWHRG